MLILGCGHIGRRVAQHYQRHGESVLGIVRSTGSLTALEDDGIKAMALDLANPSIAGLDAAGERMFHFVPPPARGVEDAHTRRLVHAFACQSHPRRLVYISTTGVYGDCKGDWVDETRSPAPTADRACRRWDAEQILRRWSLGSGGELVILRVAGIYGPGRLPLERISRGLPVVCEDEAPYSNRIHSDDLVQVCIAAMERGSDGAVYNVCDGNPSTMTDYFYRVADRVGLKRPPAISLHEAEGRLSPEMLSYLRESRRLRNRRMLEELGVELRFPTLEAGLRNSL